MASAELGRYFRRSDPAFVAAVIGLVSGLALLDCLFYQLLRGEADLRLAGLWLATAVTPWALCWLFLQRVSAGESARPGIWALAIGAAACAAAVADLLILGQAALSAAELAKTLQAELPIAAAFTALLVLAPAERPEASSSDETDRFAAVAGCDLCRAAGNYVEVVRGARVELIRASLADVEAELRTRGYVRVHRSALVREAGIIAFENDRRGLAAIRLATGERVKVGRSYRTALYGLRRRPG